MLPIETRVDKSNPLPRYHQVRHILLGMVTSGAWKPGEKIPSEIDIADTLGVSKMTVNKAILALTAERVFSREVGRGTFVAGADPFQGARTVAGKPGKPEIRTIHLVNDGLPELLPDNEYFCSLALAARCHVSPLEVRLVSQCLHGSDYLARYTGQEATGWLVISPDESDIGGLNDLAAANARAVVLGASWEGVALPYVDSDNVQGATLAVDHLASLGHRDIAMLYGQAGSSNTYDRVVGFREAMSARGLPLRDDWMIGTVDFQLTEAMVQRLHQWMRSRIAPTAIFAAGPFIARALLQFMQEHEIDVPRQVSIVSFDDPSAVANVSPLLTTIVQPLEEMARVGIDHLAALSTNSSPLSDLQTILPCRLEARGSTGPL